MLQTGAIKHVHFSLTSFRTSDQLFGACSTEKQGEPGNEATFNVHVPLLSSNEPLSRTIMDAHPGILKY